MLTFSLPQLQVLDELASRVTNRCSINYPDKEYDGCVPPESSSDVHLEDRDIGLISSLFDFAGISGSRHIIGSSNGSHRNEAIAPRDSVQHAMDRQLEGSDGGLDNAASAQGDSTGIGQDTSNTTDCQLGEDWLFLGQPWETYLPNLD